MTTLIY